MKGRLHFLPMSLLALVLVLSLVAVLAPDAGAQDSGVVPDEPAEQTQYDVLAQQDLETAGFSSGIGSFGNRYCCITFVSGPMPGPDAETDSSTASSPVPNVPYANGYIHRWACSGYQTGY